MVIEPTCTAEGLTACCCRGYGINCRTTFDEVTVSATGHTLWEVEEYLVEPTATLPGIGLGRCGVCDMEGAEQELPPIFRDVTSNSFYSVPLDYCYDMGWVSGVTFNTFAPNNACVRAQVVTFLWRAFGEPACETAEHPFTDVQARSWYEQPVRWAVEEGITSGMSATAFGPVVNCNRAQIVTFLYRTYAE